MPKSARTYSANLAAEHRKRNPDPARIAELRQQHFEAKVTEWVERQIATAPPLSQATRTKLAALLSGQPAAHADVPVPGADAAA